MKKTRLLLLLALLLTAATGAWAQSAFTAKEITSASQLTSTDDEAYVAACMPSDFWLSTQTWPRRGPALLQTARPF
jgi:hypothetical protein